MLVRRFEPQPAWIVVDRAELRRALAATNQATRETAQTTARGGTIAAAAALAQAIRFSKQQALRDSAQPVPPEIREAVARHFPDDVLDEVRWATAGRRIGLGSLLTTWYLKEGAVTLDNVVVFSDRQTARHLALWVHEMTHVVQYRELGVSDFARLYAAQPHVLEEQAWRNTRRVMAAIRRDQAAAREAEARRALSEEAGSMSSVEVIPVVPALEPAPSL